KAATLDLGVEDVDLVAARPRARAEAGGQVRALDALAPEELVDRGQGRRDLDRRELAAAHDGDERLLAAAVVGVVEPQAFLREEVLLGDDPAGRGDRARGSPEDLAEGRDAGRELALDLERGHGGEPSLPAHVVPGS